MPQLPQSNSLKFHYVLCVSAGRPAFNLLFNDCLWPHHSCSAKLWKYSEMMWKVHLFVVGDNIKLCESNSSIIDRGTRWGGGLLWNFTLLWLFLIFDVGGGAVNEVWELQTWMWQHAAIQRRAAAAAAPGRQEACTAPERRGGRQACSRRRACCNSAAR